MPTQSGSRLLRACLRGAFLIILSGGFSAQSVAQTYSIRPIPNEAKKADFEIAGDGMARINGRSMALSPGVQIRDAENRIVLPQAMNGKYATRVQLDEQGNVHRVWILSPAERAQKP